jgi:hypothetical protein
MAFALTRPAARLAARPRAAATTYVTAWVAGLAVLPAGPDPHATAAQAVATLDAHRGTAALQSWLVHGVAAAALAWLALALLRMPPPRREGGGQVSRARGWARVAVTGAVALSLLQVVLLHAAVLTADPAAPTAAAAWLHAVNLVDVAKLAFLGASVALLARAVLSAGGARAVTAFSVLVAGVLPVAGLAFVWDSPVLSAVLTASLVLLLAWALVVAFSVSRVTALDVSRGAARDASPAADGTLGAEPAVS